jgi:hypothetical protein
MVQSFGQVSAEGILLPSRNHGQNIIGPQVLTCSTGMTLLGCFRGERGLRGKPERKRRPLRGGLSGSLREQGTMAFYLTDHSPLSRVKKKKHRERAFSDFGKEEKAVLLSAPQGPPKKQC